jgi:hypothetical protein
MCIPARYPTAQPRDRRSLWAEVGSGAVFLLEHKPEQHLRSLFAARHCSCIGQEMLVVGIAM